MNGTQLCCLFSGITNKLQYCGPPDSFKTFVEHVKTGEHEDAVRQLLSRFEGLYPYLQFIAGKHSLDPFDRKVVEAYWLGNELLDAFSAEEFRAFLPELGKRGLPASVVEELQSRVPDGALPHHTFNVLWVGVGRITDSVPTNVESMRQCMASWGEVVETGELMTVRGPVLELDDGRFVLSEQASVVKPGVVGVSVGDVVAMHWGEVACVLDAQQRQNLEKYTRKVIAAVNASFSSS